MPAEIKTLLAGHLDLVPKLFEFLEQEEAHDFGGEGSGNWGHEGRPGEIGGSGESGGSVLSKVEAAIKETVDKQMSMYRPEQQTPEMRASVEKFVRVREEMKAAQEIPKTEIKQEAPKEVQKPIEDILRVPASKPTYNDVVNKDIKAEEERLLTKTVEKLRSQAKYNTLDEKGKEEIDKRIDENKYILKKAVSEVARTKQIERVAYANKIEAAIKEHASLVSKGKLSSNERMRESQLKAMVNAGYEPPDLGF